MSTPRGALNGFVSNGDVIQTNYGKQPQNICHEFKKWPDIAMALLFFLARTNVFLELELFLYSHNTAQVLYGCARPLLVCVEHKVCPVEANCEQDIMLFCEWHGTASF